MANSLKSASPARKSTTRSSRRTRTAKASTTRKSKRGSGRAQRAAGVARAGYFITMEGGEGAGKSTQMRRLAEWLREQGLTVTTTREPGGSPGAEAIRHVLLSGAAEPLGAEAEALLFSAARADHIDSLIKPALARGEVVISDRFLDSTRVYQGVDGTLTPEFVAQLESVAVGNAMPDLTLILDLPPEVGMKRAAERRQEPVPDRFEKEPLQLHEARREGFLAIARQEPKRCIVIDAQGDEETVFKRLRDAVRSRLATIRKRVRQDERA